MKSKSFYKQFGEDIDKEVKKYKAFSERTELPSTKCDHKGKVKIIDGELRCSCGAGWRGPEIDTLFDYFMGKDVK